MSIIAPPQKKASFVCPFFHISTLISNSALVVTCSYSLYIASDVPILLVSLGDLFLYVVFLGLSDLMSAPYHRSDPGSHPE